MTRFEQIATRLCLLLLVGVVAGCTSSSKESSSRSKKHAAAQRKRMALAKRKAQQAAKPVNEREPSQAATENAINESASPTLSPEPAPSPTPQATSAATSPTATPALPSPPPPQATPGAKASLIDRLTLSGNLTFRTEKFIDGSYVTTVGPTTGENTRTRLQFRLAGDFEVEPSLTVHTRLSTGVYTGYPWQNLSGGAVKRAFNLDLAYFNWALSESLDWQGGKMPLIFWQPGGDLLWNFMVSFEGTQAKWAVKDGSFRPWFSASYASILDRVNGTNTQGPSDGPDVALFGAQAGLQSHLGPSVVLLGVSHYNFNNIKDLGTTFIGYPGSMGNSTRTSGTSSFYLYDYSLNQAGLEIRFPKWSVPLTLYFDYVTNSKVSEENVGSVAGFKLGNRTVPGTWAFQYNYRDIRKDAVFAPPADTGMSGGGTDVNGHNIYLGFQTTKTSFVIFGYNVGKRKVSTGGALYESYLMDYAIYF